MTIDIKMMKDKIDGMIAQGTNLRADEAIFHKVQGINEAIVKAETDREKTTESLADEKKNLKELKAKKTKVVSGSASKIESKMNEILPMKNAVFDCTDGLKLGLKDGEKTTLYNGLSGGEKQVFDAALANVLDANIIVIEAAELDQERMSALLEDMAGIDKQVIINTCHAVDAVPDGFCLVEL